MMRKDNFDKYIQQTLKEKYKENITENNTEIPDIEETLQIFRDNIKRSNKKKTRNIYKYSAAVAACFIIVIGLFATNLNEQNDIKSPNGVLQVNPIHEVTTIEEAEKACGFLVETINSLPEGFSIDNRDIMYIDVIDSEKMARQIYHYKGDRIIFDKSSKIVEMEPTYEVEIYDSNKSVKIDKIKVKIYYKKNKAGYAYWTQKDYVYTISCSNIISNEDMINMVKSIITQ